MKTRNDYQKEADEMKQEFAFRVKYYDTFLLKNVIETVFANSITDALSTSASMAGNERRIVSITRKN